MQIQSVPMFPLRAVLYPGGPLPLRIFEPRYIDMVSRCVKEQSPFGVVMILQGADVDTEVRTQATGTLAKIVDWDQGGDGLLGVTAVGEDRFRVLNMEQQQDGLNVADIEVLPPEPEMPVPAEHQVLADLLQAAFDDLGEFYAFIEKRFDDASWIGYRFAEILPIDMQSKQYCLELDDPLARLEFIRPYLRDMREEQSS